MRKYVFFCVLLCLLLVKIESRLLSFPLKVTDLNESEIGVGEEEEEENKGKIVNLRKTLELPTKSDAFRAEVTLCLGTPPQCFDLTIQTNSFFLWVANANSPKIKAKHKFDRTRSSTCVRNMTDIEIFYAGHDVKCSQAKDLLTYAGEDLTRINFLIAHETSHFFALDGMLGLGYTPKRFERQYSIIQQLFENGVIAHKVFSQKYDSDSEGRLEIGEIPKHIVEDFAHYGRCKAVDKEKNGLKYKNKSWQCMGKAMYLTNASKKLLIDTHKITFLSYRKRSFAPKVLLDLIFNLFFSDFALQNKCKMEREKGHWTVINCDLDVELPDLNLEFENWVLPVRGEKLFRKLEGVNKKQFVFCQNDRRDKLILGRTILSDAEIVYDYANKEIGFYKPEVFYIGKDAPEKPKVYEFLKEEPGFRPEKFKPDFDFRPENEEGEGTREREVEVVKNEDDSVFSLATLFKKILSILIVLGIIFIFIFLVLYAIRYNQKQKINLLKTQLGSNLVSSKTIEG